MPRPQCCTASVCYEADRASGAAHHYHFTSRVGCAAAGWNTLEHLARREGDALMEGLVRLFVETSVDVAKLRGRSGWGSGRDGNRSSVGTAGPAWGATRSSQRRKGGRDEPRTIFGRIRPQKARTPRSSAGLPARRSTTRHTSPIRRIHPDSRRSSGSTLPAGLIAIQMGVWCRLPTSRRRESRVCDLRDRRNCYERPTHTH